MRVDFCSRSEVSCRSVFSWFVTLPKTKTRNMILTDQRPVSERSRKVFAPGNAVAKSQTVVGLQSCFIYIFLIWTEVLVVQQVSSLILFSDFRYTCHDRKLPLRAPKVSGAFEKRVRGPSHMHILTSQSWVLNYVFCELLAIGLN